MIKKCKILNFLPSRTFPSSFGQVSNFGDFSFRERTALSVFIKALEQLVFKLYFTTATRSGVIQNFAAQTMAGRNSSKILAFFRALYRRGISIFCNFSDEIAVFALQNGWIGLFEVRHMAKKRRR